MSFRNKKATQIQNGDIIKCSFGGLVNEHRMKKKLTYKALGAITNIDPSYLSRLETGARETPSVPVFLTICEALEIDLVEGLCSFGYMN